jgi:tRNA/rRNA methyltransferase
VLLGPRRGSNVGAACRAIKNMGASGLVVVGGEYDRDEARRTAVHADDVFDARVDAGSFEEAVAAATLVVGTTSRSKPWSIPVDPIGEVLSQARSRGTAAGEIALVFGPEDRGLSNEELSRCHRLAFVPTASEYASLNLAQAVVVCLYEWLRSGEGPARPPDAAGAPRIDVPSAPASAQADAIADLRSVLEEIGFLDGDQGERVMATITSMLTRGGLDDREVAILRGIVRQIRWAARRQTKT